MPQITGHSVFNACYTNNNVHCIAIKCQIVTYSLVCDAVFRLQGAEGLFCRVTCNAYVLRLHAI